MTVRAQPCNPSLFAGAVSALMAVIAGAFAAHGLKAAISPAMLAVFKTGAEYQMYHALALVLVGVMSKRGQTDQLLRWSGGLFVIGTVLFSGSLYALALTGIAKLGMITPLGGTTFIAGWALLAWRAWRPMQHD